jgi:hypothetical protein
MERLNFFSEMFLLKKVIVEKLDPENSGLKNRERKYYEGRRPEGGFLSTPFSFVCVKHIQIAV